MRPEYLGIFLYVDEIMHSDTAWKRRTANQWLIQQGWAFLDKGAHAFANISPCQQFVLKYCSYGLQLPTPEELIQYPLLEAAYLKPIASTRKTALQVYAPRPLPSDPNYDDFRRCVRELRGKLVKAYGRPFDTCKANCGFYNGEFVHFDPWMKDKCKGS